MCERRLKTLRHETEDGSLMSYPENLELLIQRVNGTNFKDAYQYCNPLQKLALVASPLIEDNIV